MAQILIRLYEIIAHKNRFLPLIHKIQNHYLVLAKIAKG